METNKTILLREVVSIEDKKTIGAVKDLCVDSETGKVSHYIIGDSGRGSLSILPREKAVAVGDSFITIRKDSVLLSTDNKSGKSLVDDGFRLVGTEAYSDQGNRLGSVTAFEFDAKSGAITMITLSDGSEYAAGKILFFTPRYVFVDKNGVQEVSVGSSKEPSEPAAPKADSAVQAKPDLDSSDDENKAVRDLLVGKRVSENVVSADGRFELAKGETITEEILARAQEHDALLLLTLGVEV